MLKFLYKLTFTVAVMAVVVSSSSKLSKSLQQHFLLGDSNATPQSVIVSFSQGIRNVLNRIGRLRFANLAIKRKAQREAQSQFCNKVQRDVQKFLEMERVNYETFWICNKMHIPKADYRLISRLANFSSVISIEEEKIIQVSVPFSGEVIRQVEDNNENRSNLTQISWGITKIRANRVWENYTGRGVVVAHIDTGVRVTHEALAKSWRSEYGWYDPIYGTTIPSDQHGHGTHTMGTIVGTHGIGVAPGATWISCQACSKHQCLLSALIKCGQWVLCPTLPNGESKNCSMAPNIVSNSWTGRFVKGEEWYDGIIENWRMAGIIPVFSIGNYGPACETTGSPGDRPNNIGVANIDVNDTIHWTSSRGSKLNRLTPDVAAPGTDINSAGHLDDYEYNTKTGTSMACPHVSGVIALMLEKDPTLKYDQIYKIITSTAETSSINFNGAQSCGGVAVNQFPNNVFGYGRIDALNAINAV